MSALASDVGSFTIEYFRKKFVDVDLTTRLSELNIDSLDLVEFLMALEEKFKVEIGADEIDEHMPLEQFCRLVARGQ